MMLNLINKVVSKKEVSYKAEVNELDAIYSAIESEEYLTVKALSLEQIKVMLLIIIFTYRIYSQKWQKLMLSVNTVILIK